MARNNTTEQRARPTPTWPPPIIKQIPGVVLFASVLAINAAEPAGILRDPPFLTGSVLCMLAATLLAVALSIRPRTVRHEQLVPGLDVIAIAMLLVDNPLGTSVYSLLVLLPVFWLASEEGRRYVLYSLLAVLVVTFMPLLASRPVVTDLASLLRLVFAWILITLSAYTVNELARRSRATADALRASAARTALALAESEKSAAQLAASEVELTQAVERFRQVWEAVTEQSVIGTDTAGLIDAWNPGAERMLGLTEADVQGQSNIVEFHASDVAFDTLVAEDDGAAHERTYVAHDGSEVPVEVTVTRRSDSGGAAAGYLFIARDVSREREVTRLKDEFIGLVSHELRTPLSSILGYLELLRDDNDDPGAAEDRAQYIDVIERNSNRLLRLVGDLLLTAQVESGVSLLALEPQSLAQVVEGSIQTLRPRIDAADLTLISNIDAEVMVPGDSLRLGQVVDNLLSNAIKFTPRGGTLTLTVARDGQVARLSVADTGIGIPADEVSQLFDRFFRASTATKGAISGIGLGLAITKAIVEAHNGTIGVTSDEGVGTTFTVTLPIAAA